MKLTEELRTEIDGKSYAELLREVRFAPIGASIFQGESGDYWLKRMHRLRSLPGGDAEHIAASKKIGWGEDVL